MNCRRTEELFRLVNDWHFRHIFVVMVLESGSWTPAHFPSETRAVEYGLINGRVGNYSQTARSANQVANADNRQSRLARGDCGKNVDLVRSTLDDGRGYARSSGGS